MSDTFTDAPDSGSAKANEIASQSPPESERSQQKATGKARKPYTITRARERWTDEEHLLFLEGMKLHGRSWGRVAEHVRSKTTIQIRSHAQKYFNRVKRMQETQPGAVLATEDPIKASHPALQSWQKPARSAPLRTTSADAAPCSTTVDPSFQRAAEIVAAAATEAAAAAAGAVVAAAGKRMREHMDLLQAQQGSLATQMQASLHTAQQTSLLAQAQAGLPQPSACCQASTANVIPMSQPQQHSAPQPAVSSCTPGGAASTLSHLALGSASSQATGTHTGVSHGTGPPSNTESISTAHLPSPFGGIPGGLTTLGAGLEAHIIQQAMQRVSAMFGSAPMPSPLAPGMQAATMGLLNPQLLQAHLAASGMQFPQPKPHPQAGDRPSGTLGSTSMM